MNHLSIIKRFSTISRHNICSSTLSSFQKSIRLRYQSSVGGGKGGEVPDEYYDAAVEEERQFCDLAMSLIHKRGIEGLNTISKNHSWKDIAAVLHRDDLDINPQNKEGLYERVIKEIQSPSPKSTSEKSSFEKFVESLQQTKGDTEKLKQTLYQLAAEEASNGNDATSQARHNLEGESDSEYEDEGQEKVLKKEAKRKPFIPGKSKLADYLKAENPLDGIDPIKIMTGDFSDEDNTEEKHEEMSEELEKFIPPSLQDFTPNTEPSKFAADEQGLRKCSGSRQRNKDGILNCHLIDLKRLNYLDVYELARFMTIDSEIKGRSQTGLCKKCQKKVSMAIKKARNIGIVPHAGNLSIIDAAPERKNKPFHMVSDLKVKRLGGSIRSTLVVND